MHAVETLRRPSPRYAHSVAVSISAAYAIRGSGRHVAFNPCHSSSSTVHHIVGADMTGMIRLAGAGVNEVETRVIGARNIPVFAHSSQCNHGCLAASGLRRYIGRQLERRPVPRHNSMDDSVARIREPVPVFVAQPHRWARSSAPLHSVVHQYRRFRTVVLGVHDAA